MKWQFAAIVAISTLAACSADHVTSVPRLAEGEAYTVQGETQVFAVDEKGQVSSAPPRSWHARGVMRGGVVRDDITRPAGSQLQVIPDEAQATEGGWFPVYAAVGNVGFTQGQPGETRVQSFRDGNKEYHVVLKHGPRGGPADQMLVFADRVPSQVVQLKWRQSGNLWELEATATTFFRLGHPAVHIVSRRTGEGTQASLGSRDALGAISRAAELAGRTITAQLSRLILPQQAHAQMFVRECAQEYRNLAVTAALMSATVFGGAAAIAGSGGMAAALAPMITRALVMDYMWSVWRLRECIMRHRVPATASGLLAPDWLEQEIEALITYCFFQNPYDPLCA